MGRQIYLLSAFVITTLLASCDGSSAVVLPVLSVGAGTGGEETSEVVFTVNLSKQASKDITFKYYLDLVDGVDTARQTDFVSMESWDIEEEGVIVAGSSTLDLIVQINNDNENELDETFSLVLTDAAGATFDSHKNFIVISGTIVDDDNPVLSISAGSSDEGTDANGSVVFEVSLSVDASESAPVLFNYTTELIVAGGIGDTGGIGDIGGIGDTGDIGDIGGIGDTGVALAKADDLIITAVKNLEINSGNTASITIPAIADNFYEGDEIFNLVIRKIRGATLADGATKITVVGTIANDDYRPVLSIADASKMEGTGDLVFMAELSKPALEDISFEYATSVEATDTADIGDFVALPLTSLIIDAGDTTAKIAVVINDDNDNEHEFFTLTISKLTVAMFADIGDTLVSRGTIVDDEATSSDNTISIAVSSGSEGTDTNGSVVFAVSLGREVSVGEIVSFDYTTELITTGDNLAEEDDIREVTARTVAIYSGDIATISIATTADNIYEGNETFNIVISSIIGATLAQGASTTVIGVINNDDDIRVLNVADVSTAEGASKIRFRAILNRPAFEDISFKYATSIEETDTAETGDFRAIPLTSATIDAGNTVAELAVLIATADNDTDDEIFTITLSELKGAVFESAGDTLVARGNIIDDDIVAIADLSLKSVSGGEEDGKVIFIFELSSLMSGAVIFKYRTEIGSTDTAQQADFTAILEATRVIPAGSLTTTIEVFVAEDAEDEVNETFSLVLSELSQEVVFEPVGSRLIVQATILDNDSIDADGDGDGLIDIDSAIKLNKIRYNVEGTSYKNSKNSPGDDSGCPPEGCRGYELLNDIDLKPFGNWKPIQGQDYTDFNIRKCRTWGTWDNDRDKCIVYTPFSAIFDGNGYTISNLGVSRSVNCVGLFGRVSGMVKNLKLRGGSVAHTGVDLESLSGAVAGELRGGGIIDTVSADLAVSGNDAVGGLVGRSYGTIRNSYVSGAVAGASNVGGLVGHLYSGDVRNSYATGAVVGERNLGGLVGYVYAGAVRHNYALGNVNGGDGNRDKVGRVVGDKRDGTIFGNYALSSSILEGGAERSFGSDEVVLKTADDLKALVVGTTETDFSGDNNGWSESNWDFTTGKYPSLKSYKLDETNASDLQIEGDLLCKQGVYWGQGDEWVQCSS